MTLHESYPGWSFPGDIHAIFHYMAAFDDAYFYKMDAVMMYMSKGGVGLANLLPGSILGPRTKDRYLKALQEVMREANSTEDSTGSSTDGDPPLPPIG